MRLRFKPLLLIAVSAIVFSCRTINTMQTSVVKRFAGTSKEITDLPYKLLYNYYTIEFKRKQLSPEIYVSGKTKEELDQLAENVMTKIEDIRKEYYADLRTASQIRTVYELLQTYIGSLEKLSDDKYSKDFEKKSIEMGAKMNGLVSKFNASPGAKKNLPVNPGDWLTSLLTAYGRIKLKTKQAELLRDYITRADTLVQAINENFHQYQLPYIEGEFESMQGKVRNQFKRTIFPYLQYLAIHKDSTTSVAAVEFYSKIIPVYYDLTDEIQKNRLLVHHADSLMNNLAYTHGLLKNMFIEKNNWVSVLEEVDGLKEKFFIIKDLFDKEGQQKFSFYKNFIMQNETTFKDIIDKR